MADAPIHPLAVSLACSHLACRTVHSNGPRLAQEELSVSVSGLVLVLVLVAVEQLVVQQHVHCSSTIIRCSLHSCR